MSVKQLWRLLYVHRSLDSTKNWQHNNNRAKHFRIFHGIYHYDDVIMNAIASQITSLTIVYSIVYSDADQRKHQSSASLAFVRGIHRGPVNSPHKWPVTRKMFPFDDVIMISFFLQLPRIGVNAVPGPVICAAFAKRIYYCVTKTSGTYQSTVQFRQRTANFH